MFKQLERFYACKIYPDGWNKALLDDKCVIICDTRSKRPFTSYTPPFETDEERKSKDQHHDQYPRGIGPRYIPFKKLVHKLFNDDDE